MRCARTSAGISILTSILTLAVLPSAAVATQPALAGQPVPEDQPVLIQVDGDAGEARATLLAAGVPADAIETIDGLETLMVDGPQTRKALTVLDDEILRIEVDAEVRAMSTWPNDPYHGPNWGMQTSNVDAVWASETGESSVVIAVIDTGVTEVTDLQGRLTAGYDFVNDDADPVDDEGHGTQSAMVAAAAGNNNHGAAGACWGCRIMPVKVLGADGSGSYGDVAAGIVWAADNGADIINLSLGGPSPSATLTAAVNYARDHGVLVIAAAGNDGVDQVSYPGATPGVLGVAANNSSGYRYSWSNFSTADADIAAPGCLIAQNPLDNGWYWFCGTSAASPLVAGAAGLLLSQAPWSTATDLERALRVGATHLPWVSRYTADGTLDAEVSRLALTTVDTAPPTITLTSTPPGAYVKGAVTVTVSIGDNRGVRRVEALSGTKVLAAVSLPAGATRLGPTATLTIDSHLISNGLLTLRAVDLAGNAAETTVQTVSDNSAPSLTITTPASRVLRGSETLSVTTADSGSGVATTELWLNNTKLTTANSAPWSLVVDTTALADGTHTFEVRSIDSVGNVTTRTRVYRVDNTAPAAGITWPTGILRGRVELPYTTQDAGSGVQSVELLAGGTVIARSNPVSGKIFWNSYLTNGEVALTLRVTDRAGNRTENTGTLQADNTMPAVATTLPWRTQGTLTLTATATDNVAVESVTWWLQSATGVSAPVLIGSGAGPGWPVNWNSAGVGNGAARLRIDVRDVAGNLRSVQLRTTIAN
jgi:hypothetical protein